MEHDDEARLIDDILDGEAEAYAVLVRRYQTPIHALMLRLCRHPEDARDLTQEAFVTAYAKLDRFRRGARFFRGCTPSPSTSAGTTCAGAATARSRPRGCRRGSWKTCPPRARTTT
ncbi:MAG: RNA polymerase sigma factor [Solidesulfovibrio sp. DCME]|uniref:RNA polymerase sigma factor n=1 Tax=Solidesulfovibrio sp. DCME TaxID=3447380 RepID=UPI003D0E8850